MKKLLTLLPLVILAATACHKQPSVTPAYAPGYVLVGLKAKAPVDTAFAIANRYSLSILQVMGYVYVTPYPQDSITSLAAYLNTKPYIDTCQDKATVEKNVYGSIWALASFYYMNAAAQADWISTLHQLQLTEWLPAGTIADSLKYMVLQVPVGQEQTLINEIKPNPMVTWADLNYIVHLN